MEQSQHIYSCACLNVRVHATSVAEQLAPLEDIAGVRQCYLASKAVEVAQGKLLEIKPASSIDRSISVVRCLVCKSPVIYFRNPQLSSASSAVLLGQQQAKLPLTGSPVFLDSKTMTPSQVEEAERLPEYSSAFGMLLAPKIIGDVHPSPNIHIPLDIKSITNEFLKSEESAKYERIREFTRQQDEAFDRFSNRAWSECAIVADLVSRVSPQSPALAASARRGSVGTSGLSAMLRGQSSGGASGLGGTLAHSGPRIGGNRGTLGGIPSVDVDDRDVFDLDDDIQSPGLQQPSAIPGFGRRNMSRQSDDYSEDLDADDDSSIIAAEERGFGNFGSPGLNMPQRTDTSGITASAHIGSLPVQIPLFSGSMVGSSSLSRREINKRVGEREMNKRREENIKKIPKTFVPPHELIQQLYDRESDMLSGSKPRDSYGWSRRQAPG